jgi:hypothetical protein
MVGYRQAMATQLHSKLNQLATPVHQTIPELGPRLRTFPAVLADKHNLAEMAFTIGIGTRRLVVVFPDEHENWTAVHFDSYNRQLIEIARRHARLTDSQVPHWVLSEAIDGIRAQIDYYAGRAALAQEDQGAFERLRYQLVNLQERKTGASQTVPLSMTSAAPPPVAVRVEASPPLPVWAPVAYDPENDPLNTPGRRRGFALGLLSVILLPFTPIFSIPLGLVSIVFATRALFQLPVGPKGRGLPVLGLVLGAGGLAIGLTIGFLAYATSI